LILQRGPLYTTEEANSPLMIWNTTGKQDTFLGTEEYN
jgi:hypothetical protein